MDLPKKKRCQVCRKMFRPDSRVQTRQRACSDPACQRERRSRTQAKWRAQNPDYRWGARLQSRLVLDQAADAGVLDEQGDRLRPPEPLKVPAELAKIPWDFARAEMGVGGSDLLAILALLVVRQVKDQIEAKKPLFMRSYRATGPPKRKDE